MESDASGSGGAGGSAVLHEPRVPAISIDLGSNGCSVRVTRFAGAGTRIDELPRYVEAVRLTESEVEHRPANDCLMLIEERAQGVRLEEMQAPFVTVRHTQKLDSIASASSLLLLNAIDRSGTGGCVGLTGEAISMQKEARRIEIPGHKLIQMSMLQHMSLLQRVRNVKAPLYEWISNCERDSTVRAGGSALDLPNLRGFTLTPTYLRAYSAEVQAAGGAGGAAAAGGGGAGGAAAAAVAAPAAAAPKTPLIRIWAGLYRDFVLRAATVLLEKDQVGVMALGGSDSYLRAIKVTVCLPADGETKFPWPLSFFIYDAMAMATKGLAGKFRALADIKHEYDEDVRLVPSGSSSSSSSGGGGGGSVIARKGSSRIIICSESRAVMQFLFTQSIRSTVQTVPGWDKLPSEVCTMVIDPGHGTTDVCTVLLDKATLKVRKYLRADFGASKGGKDVDDHLEALVLAPFFDGMGEHLKRPDVGLGDFKITHGNTMERAWRDIKERWDGMQDAASGAGTLVRGGHATLPFEPIATYLRSKGVEGDLTNARRAGLARVLGAAHQDMRELRKMKKGGLDPKPPLSFSEDQELILSGPLLKTCFDKMLEPLKDRMEEAFAVVPDCHKVHLLCLAGGASNSFYIRAQLEAIVRDLGRAAPTMPAAIHMDRQKVLQPPEQLPCLGALVDAWVRSNDVEAKESCFMFTTFSWKDKNGTDLQGAALAEEYKLQLKANPKQMALPSDNIFLRDLDDYVKVHYKVKVLRIVVPIAARGKLYCPSTDIERYIMGTPDYALQGVGDVFVGMHEIDCQPDEYVGGMRKLNQRFLALTPKEWRADKGQPYQARALSYSGTKILTTTGSAKASVLRVTMGEDGRFVSRLLDLVTGAAEASEEAPGAAGAAGGGGQSGGGAAGGGRSTRNSSGSSAAGGGGGGGAAVAGGKRAREPEEEEEEEEEEEADLGGGGSAIAAVLVQLKTGIKMG